MVHSQFTGFKILSVTISNPPDYLAHAPIIDSLTFVMLSHTTTRPTLARSLHQQVLINYKTLHLRHPPEYLRLHLHLAVQPSIKFWPHFLQTLQAPSPRLHLAVQPSIKFWPHFLQTLRRANTFSADDNAHIRLLKWHTAQPASHTLTDATSRLQYPGSLSHTHPTSVISSPASSLHAYTSTPTGPPSCPFS